MQIDTEFLSRIQFAFTIAFHILFPAFSIGMASFLAVMEGLWLKTKKRAYYNICKFWTKIFALTLGMGVVSGIVMEFQLGTNWSGYTYAVGPVLGVLFTYEVLTAFFIEAGFLGIMVFGWDRVSAKIHYLATLLVLAGVTLSAFWILSANSWMQTPGGIAYLGNHFQVTDWLQVIFNHSMIPRFIHMLLAAWITTAFVIAGIHSYYLLKGIHVIISKICLRYAVIAIFFLAPLQIFIGDRVGLAIHHYQPLKTAAIEGVWETQKGAPFLVFAIPDQAAQKNLLAVGIPYMASLINTHQWQGELLGLKSVQPEDQPYVPLVFFSFRIMLAIGLLMLVVGIMGLIFLLRKTLYKKRWFLKSLVLFSPLGFVAIIAGWFTAEIGRQPWIVYDLQRTADAASNIPMWNVWISLGLIVVVYGVIFGIFYFRYLNRILHAGPAHVSIEEAPFIYLARGEKE